MDPDVKSGEYMGIGPKNEQYFRVPNKVIDDILRNGNVSTSEFVVLIFAIRHITGWGLQEECLLAARFVAEGIGLTDKTAGTALRSLIKKGYLQRKGIDRKTHSHIYAVVYDSSRENADQGEGAQVRRSRRGKSSPHDVSRAPVLATGVAPMVDEQEVFDLPEAAGDGAPTRTRADWLTEADEYDRFVKETWGSGAAK
jgi:hypothetical protein